VSQPELNFEETFVEEGFGEEPVSARATSRAAPADLPRGVLVRHPRANIYTALLGVTAAALAVGCMLMVLEIWHYGVPWSFPWNIPTNYR
jgi:hypothetical protein